MGIDSYQLCRDWPLPIRYTRRRVVRGWGLDVGTELSGRSILIVEDEPLVALDIVENFRNAGASVMAAHRLSDGLRLAGHPDLSAAVVDFGLSDGEGTALCERLKERGIPVVLHTGYHHVDETCCADMLVAKPAAPHELVSAVVGLLASRQAIR